MDATLQALEAVKKEMPATRCRPGEPMKYHTSFKIGGRARAMLFPENTQELIDLCRLLRKYGVKPLIMGNGTNLLVDDRELDIIVIKTTGLYNAERTGEYEITAGAGILLSKLAVFASGCGLSGIEFIYGIPGTLGGAVLMNSGAYGGEMKNVLHSTRALSGEDYNIVTVTGGEHRFSYRNSRFSDSGEIILSSVIRLRGDDPDSIMNRMEQLGIRRRESQPLELPSAGSTFKRPKEGYAAALIEEAGLKGFAIGGAQVSPMHSGFVVNRGGATFADVLAVIEHVKATVFKRTGIELDVEVNIIS